MARAPLANTAPKAKPTSKSSTTKPESKAKKPVSEKAPKEKKEASHPTWKEIIKECIVTSEEKRTGVSRAAIKKFAEIQYQIEMNPSNTSHLNRAIAAGTEAGIFALPKGISGKVKLAPKNPPKERDESKENADPAPKAKKVASKSETKTKAAPVKKATTTTKAKTTATTKKATTYKTTTKPTNTTTKRRSAAVV